MISLALSACDERIESFGGPTMGSSYSVKYVRKGGVGDVRQVKAEVERLLAQIDEQMSTYRADSLISRFNALSSGCMDMPEPVLRLVAYGKQLSQDSGGAFDMTVVPLMNLWGFGPESRQESIPSEQILEEVRARVGDHHLSIEGNRLCKDAHVQLSFDSIAAGYAVDAAIERLEALGIRSYLVEMTGELKAAGRKPDGSPWRIAIEAPRDGERVAQRIVDLDGYGVSTSGDYRNYFEQDGQRYSHTFDPLTGRPIQHDLASVTVIDPVTLHADGLSTLLMVLGPDQGYVFAKEHQVAALFVIRTGDAFQSRSTPKFDDLFGVQP